MAFNRERGVWWVTIKCCCCADWMVFQHESVKGSTQVKHPRDLMPWSYRDVVCQSILRAHTHTYTQPHGKISSEIKLLNGAATQRTPDLLVIFRQPPYNVWQIIYVCIRVVSLWARRVRAYSRRSIFFYSRKAVYFPLCLHIFFVLAQLKQTCSNTPLVECCFLLRSLGKQRGLRWGYANTTGSSVLLVNAKSGCGLSAGKWILGRDLKTSRCVQSMW